MRKTFYRAAKLLLDQYGANAATDAALRADAMLERGDMEGQAVWKRTVRAITEWPSKFADYRERSRPVLRREP